MKDSTVRVSRLELVGVLKANRDKHAKTFNSAMEGYRKAFIRELETSIADAKAGRRFRRSITLVEPINQISDYDRAIRMYGMSQDDVVELSESRFAELVMDEWSWSVQFSSSSSSYLPSSSSSNSRGDD